MKGQTASNIYLKTSGIGHSNGRVSLNRFFSQGCGRVLKSDAKLLRGFGILVVLKTGFSISTNILAGNWVTINLEIPRARAFFGCREGMIVWR